MGGFTTEERLARHLAANDGIITRGEAMSLGVTSSSIARRKAAKIWQPLGGGVFLSTAHPLTEAARLRAATVIAGGVADGLSAAWWHGVVDELPDIVTVTVPPARRCRVRSAIRFGVQRRSLLDADLTTVRGIAVTAAPLTVAEASAAAAAGSRIMDRALQEGTVTIQTLERALERNAGRHGIARARRLVAVAGTDTESEAERRFALLLRRHRITGWVQQYPFGHTPIDFAFPSDRLAVEIDGWAFHRTADRAAADARKQNRLMLAGWRLLRFGWHALDQAPEDAVDQVVAALGAAA
ncbi:DUF559 domain-containing protein [Tsukamurella soli]|uniref:Type IV toxin-antitoxin system AbiEi family antitoxin domain-containing protein n=1 Tax=Tsukamurella soli TaxID=644556 RepID=A0ABP8J758_9ACTN